MLKAYLGLPRETYLTALGHMALEFSHQFLPVVYPALILALGLTYAQVGVIALTASLASTVLQPLFGHLSDRWKPRLIIPISVAWIGVLMGLVGFMPSYTAIVIVVALGSLGSAAFHPAGASITSLIGRARRGAAMSVFSVSGNLGSTLSPLIVGLGMVWFGLAGPVVIIPITVLAAVYISINFRNGAAKDASAAPINNTNNQSSNSSKIALALIITAAASRSWYLGSLNTYLPEWLQSQGFTPEAAGASLSLMLFASSIGALIGGSLSDRTGRLPILLISMAGLGPAVWLLMQLSGPLQLAAVALAGFLIGATFPVTIVMAQEAWPRGTGLASALAIGLGWLPSGVGAWVVGLLADASTLTDGLSTLVYVPLVGLLAGLILWSRRKLLLQTD